MRPFILFLSIFLFSCGNPTINHSLEAGMDSGPDTSVEAGVDAKVVPDASPVDAAPGDSSLDASPVPTTDGGLVYCGTEPCACNDGLDNDGDGTVDGLDLECTGAYDNDEGSFATGLPGDNKDGFQDCFFDGNSGGGGGDCKIATSCIIDRTSEECLGSFTGQRTLEEEEAKCKNLCEPLTPNGCDCFGCCTLETATGPESVLINDSCEVESDADGFAVIGSGCISCTVSPTCGNECGECELCPGKTTLPDSCGETVECIDGAGVVQPSCVTQPCDNNSYCQQGCCVEVILI